MEQHFYLFSGLRWQDIFDILLNSYILFRLYVLFRGTNVIRMLLAICILWAVSQSAVSLGLIVTNWAMQGVITVAALIIIIVFRNEIAGVLKTKNLKSFLWGIPRHQFHTPFNIIADSVYEMSDKRIGALIVLPLKHGMENIVQGGIKINGSLSHEMLISIFWPDNPVHDGATIIQGNKIKRAGVILPLSKNPDLPAFFGTRHRAALGLVENSDALVIVVSEETGKISLFKEDQTFNIENKLGLEKLLEEHAGDESAGKGLKHQTLELTAAAVISLFCITGIWLSFSKGMETLATHEIPVEFMNPDQKMEIISSSASNVKLLISGARPLINSINPEQINIKLNLAQSVIGVNKLSITKDNVLLPPGIQLKSIEPAEIDITLDSMVEKILPVQPHWIGKLPEGLVMTTANPVPRTVKVIGGGLVLKNMSTVFTEQISLDKLSESSTITVSLVLNPATLKLVNGSKIQIHYVIKKQT